VKRVIGRALRGGEGGVCVPLSALCLSTKYGTIPSFLPGIGNMGGEGG
jgi:hypothetical protein